MGPAIQQGVTDAQLPGAWAAVTAGQRLQFGKFWVTADQIGAGNKAWTWSQIDNIRVHDGLVQLQSDNRWISLADSEVSSIENFFVFMALATRLSGVQPNR